MQIVDGRGLVIPAVDANRNGPNAADAGPGAGQRALSLAYLRYLQLTCGRYISAGTGAAIAAALRPAWGRTATIVSRLHARNPKALLGCFAAPTIGTPLHTLALREALPEFADRIAAGFASVTPHLLLELALRNLLDPGERVDWPGAPPVATLAAGVRIRPPEGATALRFTSGTLTALDEDRVLGTLPLSPEALGGGAHTGGFTVERVYHRIGPVGLRRVTRLALVDHNPIAQLEAHPDKEGNPIGLGDRDLTEWVRILDEAFALIDKHQPALFGEMGLLLHELIPVGYHAERHLSCSYREAIGTVYLTLHDNVMTMAEAIIHEFQHNKANCASYSADFLENAFEPRYKSPVRPDPRPLWGILLAVHAFIPVARLYREMRDAGHPWAQRPDWLRRLGDIDLKNHEGMEMLRAHAAWLPAGRAMFEELDAWDARHMAERSAAGLDTRPTEVHLA